MPVTRISIFQQTSKIHCFAYRTDYFSILFYFNARKYSLAAKITQAICICLYVWLWSDTFLLKFREGWRGSVVSYLSNSIDQF